VRSRRRHLFALAELVDQRGEVERCRDEYLASLGADDGLVVLLISVEEIRSAVAARRARAPARCQRCGARLPAKRHRCSRCGLACD
jgi:tRNA(Ile2) C34 agmatinyltransferase TiaS